MDSVIKVTRVNGAELLVNPDLIQTVEQRGDTVIELTNGDKIRVKDPLDAVAEKVVAYRAAILHKSQTKGVN